MSAIFLDGRLVERAAIDPADRGFLLGDGLFDTATLFGGRVWRRDDHLARLAAGAEAIGIPIGRGEIEAAFDALAPLAPAAGAVIRTTLTRGPGPRGLKPPADPRPTLLATLAPWNPDLAFRPVRAALAEARRNDRSPTGAVKTLGYLDAILETERAARRGFGEAILLDTAERVASSTMANLFVLKGRRLKTPRLAGAVLPGIVRARVLALAPLLGLGVEEADLGIADLASADGLFLTNSVRLVTPVEAFEDRRYDPAAFGPARLVLEMLRADIEAECGVTLPLGG
ncbi:hypothetical protein ABB55_09190 [Prosthecomicrobium hirschii]|uniref:Probable branched-chain-amino-acid aminotransferase n=1 Tax=Prosthecodimorpha hirschii TaxID=665126 RepID=A0A0P6VJ81_9HYPH|nr:aminotransferase class IV [Prosthecomicrobium hirschii]KPL52382.1 hypothetical protein ABB55_09190 [Prosthecomicrobium hirschii]